MTGSGPARKHSTYGWQDYRNWPREQRWEIVSGEAYAMTPAPSTRHQHVVGALFSALHRHFEGKECRPFVAPIDVRLSEQDVVQPDIAVVCAGDRIKPTHIEGAPTLVVEVLSPSSELHDRVRKMALYAQAVVREVWLVTPYPWLAEVFVLDGDSYRLKSCYSKKDTLESPTFTGLAVELRPVFDFPIPPDERIDLVKEGRPEYATR